MTEQASQVAFDHSGSFEGAESFGNLRLGKFESMYEELFAEVIEDGVITSDERKQLDKMADNLGLDRSRLARLEMALQAAYEARHKITVRSLVPSMAPMSITPLEPSTDARTNALERRIATLEARIKELETELEDARSHVNVEVDLSDISEPTRAGSEDDPVELARQLRHDPRDAESLHAFFRVLGKSNDKERQYCIASILVFLNQATEAERAVFEAHKPDGLVKPTAALTPDAWRKLLFHPEEEPVVGDIFSVVAGAVLLGRLSALRREKALPKLDEGKRQDPAVSTIQAVRCFSWAGAILGLKPSPLYLAPEDPGLSVVVPAMPPATKLGQSALSGRSAAELAFLAGRHLAYFREEHFLRALLPDVKTLEEVFLAALSIGNPGLPLASNVKQLVIPIAKAIEPILEPSQIDRLRGHFLRFVEEGGRTNLQRWSSSVEKTCARAGLLLSGDLKAAHTILSISEEGHVEERMDDLLSFVASERYNKLRKQLGIAIASE
ncbi:MAG: hypothetical protein U0174_02085 [Polyangiaceae bacterium]